MKSIYSYFSERDALRIISAIKHYSPGRCCSLKNDSVTTSNGSLELFLNEDQRKNTKQKTTRKTIDSLKFKDRCYFCNEAVPYRNLPHCSMCSFPMCQECQTCLTGDKLQFPIDLLKQYEKNLFSQRKTTLTFDSRFSFVLKSILE